MAGILEVSIRVFILQQNLGSNSILGNIEGKLNGSLIFLLVLKQKIYINISLTCTKMSKLSVLQSQLPKLPRCIYTGETKDVRKVLGAPS